MRKKFLLLVLSALLACLLVLGLTACGDKEDEPVVETFTGTKGLVYSFVSGENGAELAVTSYVGDSEEVVIPETFNGYKVTSIGSRAFAECGSLTSITIPNSVTSIGYSTFAECDSLTSITIPNSVTSIGEYAFAYCYTLTIYCEAQSIPTDWDTSWNDETPVVWDCNNNDVAEDGCVYRIIDGIRFSLKDGVATVVRQSKNLTTANIPSSITYKDQTYSVTSIGKYAFYGCNSLTSITIPNSVTSIGSEAFYYCYLLTIHCEATSKPSGWVSGWNYSNYPVVWDCNNNDVAEDGYIHTIFNETRYGIKDGVATLLKQAKDITTANIPSSITYKDQTYSVTSIGNSAFYDCYSLTSITIPNSVTSIGSSAFEYCTSLTSVTIPNSVTSIGSYAFYNCDSLTSVTIGNSVTSIGGSAFAYCESLTSVNYTGTIDQWAQIEFVDSTANPIYYAKKLYINGELVTQANITTATKINSCAFSGCDSLTSVTIGNSVTSIGYYAFSNCNSLTSVIIPNSVTSIGSGAFTSCNSLTSITIPNSVTSIGNYAFYDCDSLTSITIGNSVTIIGEYAFSDCTSLTSITIPNSVTIICEHAFSGCTSLTSVTIPNSVTSIGSRAFIGCDSLTIYCEANSEPWGWDYSWNYSNRPVVWGYTGN